MLKFKFGDNVKIINNDFYQDVYGIVIGWLLIIIPYGVGSV